MFGIENGECNFEISLQTFRSVQHFINLENCWIRFSETTLSKDHGQGWYFALELGPLVQSRELQQALGQLPNTSCLQEFLDYDGEETVRDPHYTCTKWGHHVSLAYLPGPPLVTYAEMEQLQTKLTARLQAWILTRHQVTLRKDEFLRTKKFKVYDVDDDQAWFKHDLSTWPIETIQKLVLQNRLRLDEEFPDQDACALKDAMSMLASDTKVGIIQHPLPSVLAHTKRQQMQWKLRDANLGLYQPHF